MPNRRARFAGQHEVEPERIGPRVCRGDDLHAVAVLELGPERHQLLVDLDRNATIADVGVHRVGEINRGCPARQRHDLAPGREHVNFVGKKIDLEMFEKFGRVA
ncbi:hypothetical protein D3C83_03230 [compost metagenome]